MPNKVELPDYLQVFIKVKYPRKAPSVVISASLILSWWAYLTTTVQFKVDWLC